MICKQCGGRLLASGQGGSANQSSGAAGTSKNSGVCPQCGKPDISGLKFCKYCGAKLPAHFGGILDNLVGLDSNKKSPPQSGGVLKISP